MQLSSSARVKIYGKPNPKFREIKKGLWGNGKEKIRREEES